MNVATSRSDMCGCVILVIDGSQREPLVIEGARAMLKKLVREIRENRPKLPVAVVAAKCDASGAMSSEEIHAAFQLQELGVGEIRVITSSASTGQGLKDVLQFVRESIL